MATHVCGTSITCTRWQSFSAKAAVLSTLHSGDSHLLSCERQVVLISLGGVLCVFTCVCACACVCVCAHVCAYVRVYACVCMYVCVCVCLYVCVHARVCLCVTV